MSKRTITLTNRPPVTISEENWPVIASANDKEFDNEYEFQANRISKWFAAVRQHKDGRAIVYATYSHDSRWQGERGYSAKCGMIVDAGGDIIYAINRVCSDIAGMPCYGEDCGRWQTIEAELIASLPAEELD